MHMSQTQNTSQTQSNSIEMEIIQAEIKQSKRPKSYEEACARFNATLSSAKTVNNVHYAVCLGEGRILLLKLFKGRDYYFIRSLMALEINAIDTIVDMLNEAKQKYETEVEAKRIAWLIQQNPKLKELIKKYLDQ